MTNQFEWGAGEYETGEQEYQSMEMPGETYGETYGETPMSGETYGETGSPFNETQEMELAAELLSVTNQGELDRFLGDLVKKAGQAVGSFVRSPVGQALGGVLKDAARKA